MTKIKNILLVIVVTYCALLIAVYFNQRILLYFPPQGYVSPFVDDAQKVFQELPVKTEDGLDLKGWYAPATSQPLTLVFFHGNGDGLRTSSLITPPYLATGYGVLLAEYRGYSGMPGSPTEDGLYADARAYLKALIASGVKEENIVLFGHSLGTGVATQMATEFHVRGVILLAPYMSIAKMAQVRFPIFPSEYMTKDRFESFKKIPNVHVPILMANGGRDAVIPPSQGRQLFALANEPKQFLFVPDGGHNDMFETQFVDVSLKWLQELSPAMAISKK